MDYLQGKWQKHGDAKIFPNNNYFYLISFQTHHHPIKNTFHTINILPPPHFQVSMFINSNFFSNKIIQLILTFINITSIIIITRSCQFIEKTHPVSIKATQLCCRRQHNQH
jgi:hypothetical protein